MAIEASSIGRDMPRFVACGALCLEFLMPRRKGTGRIAAMQREQPHQPDRTHQAAGHQVSTLPAHVRPKYKTDSMWKAKSAKVSTATMTWKRSQLLLSQRLKSFCSRLTLRVASSVRS